ncbi:hypothetical protein DPMN_177431 [Dreissena polymorpha]|uniref:Uncharacterized protein n=1 Tax=Dreissena polymorpha TaxID=45954 RepID=A0A9D4EB57_DREPO|nr:hypothetical protein DPMN_177431 [Dreissena polymorpha]
MSSLSTFMTGSGKRKTGGWPRGSKISTYLTSETTPFPSVGIKLSSSFTSTGIGSVLNMLILT